MSPRAETPEQVTTAKLHQLDGDVNTCVNSLAYIRDLLPEPDNTGPQTGTIGRHAPESSEPWQGAAATVYWTIHYGARRLEDSLRNDHGLHPRTPARGGSEANTISALIAVSRLAAGAPDHALLTAADTLHRWVHLIDRLHGLDVQADDWRPVPRIPGQLITCPYCTTLSLRMNLRREAVRCFNPACRDTENHPPVAQVRRDREGNARLVFRDGRTVDYRELAEIPAKE